MTSVKLILLCADGITEQVMGVLGICCYSYSNCEGL